MTHWYSGNVHTPSHHTLVYRPFSLSATAYSQPNPPSYYRKSRLYLDGELLVENFDIHNAYWQFMNCILPDKINFTERNNFYKLTTSGLFYEDVRDWINKTFGANWTREDAKLYSNTYCNTTTKYNETLKSVDAYFKENFPEIRNFIRNYKTEKQSVTKKIINKH